MRKTKVKQCGQNSTVVIDNGNSECRVGFQGILITAFPNKFYKKRDYIGFESVQGGTEKFMFDNGVITNYENMEVILDRVFLDIGLESPDGLVMTEKPYTPNFSRVKTMEMIFELYNFKRFQLGCDAIYSMHKNRIKGPTLVISFSESCTNVFVVGIDRIEQVFVLNYGAKHARKYISMILRNKFPWMKVGDDIVTDMLCNLHVCENYDDECEKIYHDSKSGNSSDSYNPFFLSGIEADEEDSRTNDQWYYSDKDEICANDWDFSKEEPAEYETLESTEEGESSDVQEADECTPPESEQNPDIKTSEVAEDVRADEIVERSTDTADDDAQQLLSETDIAQKEKAMEKKKRDTIAYFSTMYRLKQRIQKSLTKLSAYIDYCKESYDVKTDLSGYIAKMKGKLNAVKDNIRRRNNILRELGNKRSVYSRIRGMGADAELDDYEREIMGMMIWAEDIEDKKSAEKMLKVYTSKIKKYEPDFVAESPPIGSILSGVAIERRKVPEVLFEPSIIGLPGLGLVEIFEIYHPSKAFITGGFSKIYGLKERIAKEIRCNSFTKDIYVQCAGDPILDGFYGAHMSPLFPIFNREEYEEFGPENLVSKIVF